MSTFYHITDVFLEIVRGNSSGVVEIVYIQ